MLNGRSTFEEISSGQCLKCLEKTCSVNQLQCSTQKLWLFSNVVCTSSCPFVEISSSCALDGSAYWLIINNLITFICSLAQMKVVAVSNKEKNLLFVVGLIVIVFCTSHIYTTNHRFGTFRSNH